MSENENCDAINSVKFAARVAEQLLKNSDEGTKLLSVTYHYPKGDKAYGFGFRLAFGACFGATVFACVATSIYRVWEYLI